MDTSSIVAAIAAGLVILCLPALIKSRMGPLRTMKTILAGFMMLNVAGVLALVLVLLPGAPISAQEHAPNGQGMETNQQMQQEKESSNYKEMAAALAVGLSAIAAGIAVAVTGSAAIGGMTQNPDIFGRSLIFVGLAEGIAIYGLIISFMILMGFGGGGG